MKNQVIKVLNKEHGKKVIQYWKDRGVDTHYCEGNVTEEDGNLCIYYGVASNIFSNYSLEQVQKYNVEIITLNEYPKVMMVSNTPITPKDKGIQRVVFMEKNGKYLAWSHAKTLEETEKVVMVADWKYAQDIPQEPEVFEVSMKDIADKYGVPVDKLRIKD